MSSLCTLCELFRIFCKVTLIFAFDCSFKSLAADILFDCFTNGKSGDTLLEILSVGVDSINYSLSDFSWFVDLIYLLLEFSVFSLLFISSSCRLFLFLVLVPRSIIVIRIFSLPPSLSRPSVLPFPSQGPLLLFCMVSTELEKVWENFHFLGGQGNC